MHAPVTTIDASGTAPGSGGDTLKAESSGAMAAMHPAANIPPATTDPEYR